ncbi:MAG: hypothetical protein ACJ0F5_02890 [Candidatus Actinomarina sp.]
MNLQNNVSFLRIRPCDSDNEIYLNSRKKEGTSSFYINKNVNLETIHKNGFQTVSDDINEDAFQWFVNSENWKEFKDIPKSRLIYKVSSSNEKDLEVITRLNPRHILVNNLESINVLKNLQLSLSFKISKYVNSVDEAIMSINKGVEDLWLRDWSYKEIKILKEKIDQKPL